MKRVLFLLGHLNDLDIEWMINNGHKETIRSGDILIHRDEPIENLYIILSGQLSIRDGITNINEIATVGSGEILGEMSFLEARSPSVSVTASEACEIFVISKTLIEERMQMDLQFKSNFYYALALFLSNRLRKTTDQLGFGNPEDADMIDANVLDGVAQAGARFSQILKKFSEV
ncbi:cAMP-binding proteins - catabolite gene activator and regulatory subunit of cAMP-dependent protein kinases [hydrothermal vent metagenome]|uniref:cAMP-binding proteins - catabolite gene activator and regulatory subunit of cAMP-dependent protein kinases n=1 Tax=hydrothermal vent metagenome TaxID=652676 RepID=A0A3B0T1N8_9ZZZZ